MTHILRSLIREALLLEEVYGAQAVVYHGTKADPQKLISALLNDEFRPGEGAGSMYGKGLYTVYDPEGAQTMTGGYGKSVIKLKVNLYGYIIFDSDTAQKVYGSALTPVEQVQKLGYSAPVVQTLRNLNIKKLDDYTSDAALEAYKSIQDEVKGIVFTGRNDGRVVVIYDPTTVVPVAWKRIGEEWQRADRDQSGFKSAIRRSATGEYTQGKYEQGYVKLFRSLLKLPLDKRIVTKDLDLAGEPITSLPDGLKVQGTLNLIGSTILSLPKNLEVQEDLALSYTDITSLPQGLRVGGGAYFDNTKIESIPADFKAGTFVDLGRTKITSLPAGLQFIGDLNLSYSKIKSLPDAFKVGRSLNLKKTPIDSLPENLQIGYDLYLSNTRVKQLPAGLKVGASLHLTGTPVSILPDDLQVGGNIYGFGGDLSSVPHHLKSKIKGKDK